MSKKDKDRKDKVFTELKEFNVSAHQGRRSLVIKLLQTLLSVKPEEINDRAEIEEILTELQDSIDHSNLWGTARGERVIQRAIRK